MAVQKKLSSILPIIQWHEGMLLSPHHFQQTEIRNFQMLSQQISLLSSCHWGVQALQIDPIVLPEGTVRILEVGAIMPDGLIASYNAAMSDIPPLEIDLTPFKDNVGKDGLTVSLCLPGRMPNVSPIAGDNPRFYSIEWPAVKDENTDDNPLSIPRLFPRLFLHVGEPYPPLSSGFPILKIGYVDECFVQMPFTPPCFFVERDMPLWVKCAETVQKIREKVSFLTERWESQVGTPLAYETESMLKPLMMALPIFEMIIHSAAVSPYRMYQQLCETIGHLCTLRLSQVPPVLTPYDHNNINGCFFPLLNLIHEYLKSIDHSFSVFSFMNKDRLFSLRLFKNYCEQDLIIGLKSQQGMTETQLQDWMNGCIIASDSMLESVQSKRISGASRYLLRDEELYEVMPGRGTIIFKIPINSEFIKIDEKLNIYNPADSSDKRPSEVMLYIPKMAGGAGLELENE
jgi:type VI secretion system protein ImpJ